ncbi:MAG: hypothetical protein G01um101417_75 [Parcubacteria group bacterium Gr01-1014_17]|nr:MAG: hypothetical protein G01um101417_75 [Parcubacteria group bacterium Gr01-1014_17]
MFGLFEKLNDPENAHHERIAFVVALLLTGAIGGAWFYFSGSPSGDTPRIAETVQATSSVPADDVAGPLSNFRAEMADAAIFLASQVRKIGDLWKGFDFGKPVEFQRQEEDIKSTPFEFPPPL